MTTIELSLQEFECPSCRQQIGVGVYELLEPEYRDGTLVVPVKLVATKINHRCGEWGVLRDAPDLSPQPWPGYPEKGPTREIVEASDDEAQRNADLLARFQADVDAASEAARATGGFTTSEQ